LAKGKAEGEAKGKAEGEAKGKAELLLRQIGLRFGVLAPAVREKILSAAPERLDVWAERVITGRSLDEILG
jgi:predicted transposase YdaD